MTPNNQLRLLRERAGMTKGEVAEAAGISMYQLAKLEAGTRPLKWEYLRALGRVFGVNPNEIAEPALVIERIGIIVGDGDVRLFSDFDPQAVETLDAEGFDTRKPLRIKTFDGATERTASLLVCNNSSVAIAGSELFFENTPLQPDEQLGVFSIIWPAVVGNDELPACRVGYLHRGREYGRFDIVAPSRAVTLNVPVRGASRISLISLPE